MSRFIDVGQKTPEEWVELLDGRTIARIYLTIRLGPRNTFVPIDTDAFVSAMREARGLDMPLDLDTNIREDEQGRITIWIFND